MQTPCRRQQAKLPKAVLCHVFALSLAVPSSVKTQQWTRKNQLDKIQRIKCRKGPPSYFAFLKKINGFLTNRD